MDFDGSQPQQDPANAEQAGNASGTPGKDFSPRKPLPDSELNSIRKKLRHEGTPLTTIPLPPAGEDMRPYLKEQLAALGYEGTRFFIRQIDNSRLKHAITTGTDRDKTSAMNHKRGETGEVAAMLAHGLDPIDDRDLITYVHDLDLTSPLPWSSIGDDSPPLLIYARDGLEFIHPPGHHKRSSYNGLAMFKDRRLISPSLLAVITSAHVEQPIPQQRTWKDSITRHANQMLQKALVTLRRPLPITK